MRFWLALETPVGLLLADAFSAAPVASPSYPREMTLVLDARLSFFLARETGRAGPWVRRHLTPAISESGRDYHSIGDLARLPAGLRRRALPSIHLRTVAGTSGISGEYEAPETSLTGTGPLDLRFSRRRKSDDKTIDVEFR